jgi:hypothetical protein
MDKSKKTITSWIEWCNFIRKQLPDQKFEIRFASYQWKLYWNGERGSDLSDLAIHLIDNYGY